MENVNYYKFAYGQILHIGVIGGKKSCHCGQKAGHIQNNAGCKYGKSAFHHGIGIIASAVGHAQAHAEHEYGCGKMVRAYEHDEIGQARGVIGIGIFKYMAQRHENDSECFGEVNAQLTSGVDFFFREDYITCVE